MIIIIKKEQRYIHPHAALTCFNPVLIPWHKCCQSSGNINVAWQWIFLYTIGGCENISRGGGSLGLHPVIPLMVIIDNALLLLLLLSRFSRVWLCDPIDVSPPGSSDPGILQARTLERVAISFSSAWKWKVKVKSLSHVRLFVTPWTAAHQAPLPMGFSRQEYWSGVSLRSSRTLKMNQALF